MEISKRHGYSAIIWEAISNVPMTLEECQEEQANNGYHPAGYNFYGWKESKTEDNKFKYRWECYNSCD
jgi:hypothetical protein